MKIRRSVYDTLLKLEHGSEAVALYIVLMGAHGHIPGKVFAIVAPAMRASGLINLAEKKITRARNMLIENGYLIQVSTRSGKGKPNEYQLTRPTVATQIAA